MAEGLFYGGLRVTYFGVFGIQLDEIRKGMIHASCCLISDELLAVGDGEGLTVELQTLRDAKGQSIALSMVALSFFFSSDLTVATLRLTSMATSESFRMVAPSRIMVSANSISSFSENTKTSAV